MYAVIVENDISEWEDATGSIYHFPHRYESLIPPGTKVMYYKGKIQDKTFESTRMSNRPHYFGLATIGKIYNDPKSRKNDKFATIQDFKKFERAVPIKVANKYLETIPVSRESNYWRDGVRKITYDDYQKILSCAKVIETVEEIAPYNHRTNDLSQDLESFSEGDKKGKFTSFYERDSRLRKQAILIHGTTCKACEMNFENKYGTHGKDFVHVHHIKPISEYGGSKKVDPETDLTVLCPNCHSMVHRFRDKTLSIKELTSLLQENA